MEITQSHLLGGKGWELGKLNKYLMLKFHLSKWLVCINNMGAANKIILKFCQIEE